MWNSGMVFLLGLAGLLHGIATNEAVTGEPGSVAVWKKKLTESHLTIPRTTFAELKGSFAMLARLRPRLSPDVHQTELEGLFNQLSQTLGFPVSSAPEAAFFLHFFTHETAGGATRASGFLLFLNFVKLLAGLAVLFSLIYVLRDWVLPFSGFFRDLVRYLVEQPYKIKRWIALCGSLLLLRPALAAPVFLRSFVGLFVTFLIACAVRYFMDSSENGINSDFILNAGRFSRHLSSVLVAVVGAVLFDSDLIGFVAVLHFFISTSFLGYETFAGSFFGRNRAGRLSWMITFSGVLLVLYLTLVLTHTRPPTTRVFESGVFFCSTFAHFLSLIVALWEFKNTAGLHILTLVSGLACFYFGSLSPDLTILRGVSTTFFVIYLLERLSVVRWGPFWSLGLFVGGALIFAYASLLRAYWTFFI